MSKTMTWPARAMYILIALALAISLVIVAAPTKVDADLGTTKWTKVTTPSETNVTIFQCSDLYDFAVGPDGETVYVIGVDDEWDPALWKSTDGGATWKDLSSKLLKANIQLALPYEFNTLTQIAVAPDNKDFVVVAGYDSSDRPMVVGSTNGGTTFYYTGTDTKLAAGETIVCMDVSRGVESVYNIAAGTDYGKVWRYEASTYWGSTWADASAYTGWKAGQDIVTSVAFSPNWAVDKTVLAISATATKTYLQSGKWAIVKGWGSVVEEASAVEIKVENLSIVPITVGLGLPTNRHGVTGIALPSDYTGYEAALRRVFVYVDTDSVEPHGGYLFRIDNTTLSVPCSPTGNPWLGSIAYYGTSEAGDMMLGVLGETAPATPDFTDCCAGIQVYRTDEIDLCCPTWSKASKPPSGRAFALVAFTPDGKKAYATTVGAGYLDESSFSVSLDKGKCWNQLGLIDTHINKLSDVAVSPDCSVTYLSSINENNGCDCDSVWMKDANAEEYAGVWQRIYHKSLNSDWGLLRLSPEHDDGDVVYWGDMGTENLYWASDKGICAWSSRDTTVAIQDFALADDDTVYVVESGGEIVKWTEASHDWSTAVDTKCATPHTIAVLGDWVLVGGTGSKVSYSTDGAATFTALDDALSGDAHVAFDSYFEDNDTIYAATSAGKIQRWVIGISTSWKDLNAESYTYTGIVLDNADGNPKTSASTGGVLYASYVRASGDSGVARCLTQAATPCCTSEHWDYLEAGLGTDEWFDAEPSSLKLCGCLTSDSNTQLFAIDNEDYQKSDGKDGTVWAYEDCFSKEGVTLTAVANGATVAADPYYCCNEEFVLSWERLCNACMYDVKIYLDEGLTELYTTWTSYDPPDDANPTLVVDQCALDCDTQYWWTVTAVEAETGEVIHSWPSAKWSFTVEAVPGPIQPASPTRELPATVMPGDEFEVTVTFTSPHADFHAIGLTDVAPPGWNVSVDTAWATPSPMDAYTPAPEEAVYIWAGPYPAGVEFTAVYKVQVPVDAELESYTFSGSLEYYIEPHPAPSHQEVIAGDDEVQVAVAEIEGKTREVDSTVLPGVTITLYQGPVQITSTVSNDNGNYTLVVPELGDYVLAASKEGYRDEAQPISITESTTYTLDFVGNHGLIPDAPDTSYVLACISLWKLGEPPLQLGSSRVLAVISAWKFPILGA